MVYVCFFYISILQEIAKPLVEDVLKGYNGTILAYGQVRAEYIVEFIASYDRGVSTDLPSSYLYTYLSLYLPLL